MERTTGSVVLRTGALLVAGLLAVATGAAGDPAVTRTVLLVNSYSHGQPVVVEGDRGFLGAIRSTVARPVTILDQSLDTPLFAGDAYEADVVAFLIGKFRSRSPDVVVAVGHESLAFLLRHRATAFPGVPVVHAGIDPAFLRAHSPLPPDVVGVPVKFDFTPTLELALVWHPGARRLVTVTGTSPMDRQFEGRLRAAAARFEGGAELEMLAGLPFPEVLRRLAELGDDTVVFTPGIIRDGEGRELTPRDSVAAMAEVSAAPVYSAFSTLLGTGIVGGYMVTFEDMGKQAGQAVSELLAGVSPQSLQLPELMPQTLHVDWRQLRRWGVDERMLPDGAVLHFREPTLLEAYRTEVAIAVGVMAVQAALIGLLLVERQRRRLAEQTGKVQRLQLAHASRLAVAGELAASIAHEINQPLGAILANADAADLMLQSGAGHREELLSILADIRRDDRRASEVIRRLRALLARQEVERRPLDLNEVLRDTESLLGAEARRRRVELRVRPAPVPLEMVGDPIQVQQVLVNLVLNAMDAVVDLPEERRAVAVHAESVEGGAAVEVRDRGPGIPPEHLPKLFDPFFTTKATGMGLGLPIARTLVQAHGGRIRVENDLAGGAVLRVELPSDGVGGGAWAEQA